MWRCFLVILAATGCGGSAADPTTDAALGGDGPATGADASAGADQRLYPLAAGRSWTYDVTSTYPSCPGGQHEQRVVGTGMTDGRATFEVLGFCVSVEGDRVEDYFTWGPKGWLRSLDEPVAAGHTWTTTNGSATFTMTYSAAGSVGAYPDCWKVTQNVSYTSYWIYCRGVGLVRYEMIDLGGGTIRAELRGKSF